MEAISGAPRAGDRVTVLMATADGPSKRANGHVSEVLDDEIFGTVLEIELESGRRIQRIWPNPLVQF